MRYKYLQLLTVILAGCLLLAALNSDLTLYIHPRYITFTTVSVGIGFVLLLLGFRASTQKQLDTIYRSTVSTLPVLIVTTCAIVLAPASLSQSLASSRSSVSQQNNVDQTTHSTLDSFSSDLTRFSIADWNNLLAAAPSSDDIENKQANVEGFLYRGDNNQLFVARFRLTCCAVDATPLAIPLVESDELTSLELGQWVSLEGSFTATSDNADHPWQLQTSSVQSIEEPDDPYVF